MFLCRLQYVHSAMFPRVMDGVLHFGFSAHAVLNIIHGTVHFLKTRLYFPANHWPLPHDEWVSLLACLKALCCAIGTLWPGRWGCTLCKCKSRSCAFKNKIHQCNELFKGLITVVWELRQQHPSDMLSGAGTSREHSLRDVPARQQITRGLLT